MIGDTTLWLELASWLASKLKILLDLTDLLGWGECSWLVQKWDP